MIYLKDHALTKGFAVVRRSRAALAGISHVPEPTDQGALI